MLAYNAFTQEQESKQQAMPDVNANIALASDYVAKPGFIPGEGVAKQAGMQASFKGINAFMWSTHDISDNVTNEVDVGLSYGVPIIDDKLSASAGYQHWFFPVNETSSSVAQVGLHYKGGINIDATVSQLIGEGQGKDGRMVFANASKPIEIAEGISLVPNVKAAYLDDFYKEFESASHVTPGLQLQVGKGPFGFGAYISQQIGLHDEVQNRTYGGVSFSAELNK